MVEMMQEDSIVGAADGAKPREVHIRKNNTDRSTNYETGFGGERENPELRLRDESEPVDLGAASQKTYTHMEGKMTSIDPAFNRFKTIFKGIYFLIAVLLFLIATFEGHMGDAVVATLLWLIFSPIYMLPTYMAWKRGHDSKWVITIVNVLFGISIIGWVIVLLLSLEFINEKQAAVLAFLAPNRGKGSKR